MAAVSEVLAADVEAASAGLAGRAAKGAVAVAAVAAAVEVIVPRAHRLKGVAVPGWARCTTSATW